MFGHILLTCIFVLLVYYLVGCSIAIIGISLNSDTVRTLSSVMLYFPLSLVMIIVVLVLMIAIFPISLIVGIKDIISTRLFYNGGIKEARKLMEEIEAEESDKDDENDSI